MKYKKFFQHLELDFDSLPRKIARKILKTHQHPKSLWSILKNLPPNAKIIDVGCGTGQYLKILFEQRPDLIYFGLDLEPVNFKANRQVSFLSADMTSETLSISEKFNVVICNFVLEHIDFIKVDTFINNLIKLGKEKAIFFVTVPNSRSILFSFFDDPTHIRPYTHNALKKLFEGKGLTTIDYGIDRSLKILLFSPFYILYQKITRQNRPINFFLIHLIGQNSFYLGRKDIDSA